MNILVDNKGFFIEAQRLTYNLYYFGSDQFDAPTQGGVFKNLLIKWAKVVFAHNVTDDPLFFPYAPDDQWTECIKTIQHDNRLTLTNVKVDVSGYQIDMDNIEEFMTSSPRIFWESDELLGKVDKNEFISALLNSQVIDD